MTELLQLIMKEEEGGGEEGKEEGRTSVGLPVTSLPSHTASRVPPDPLSHGDNPFEPTLHFQQELRFFSSWQGCQFIVSLG